VAVTRGVPLLLSALALVGPAFAKPLDECERACGYSIAECLHERVSGRASRRVYRDCQRLFLPACRSDGTAVCVAPPPTTTTTLPAVPDVSLSGRWVLELDLLEVFRCTTPSTVDSLVLDIQQDGTSLTATVRGNGSRLSGYSGQVTNAGFTLGIRYKRRIAGLPCRGDVSIVANGFGPAEIPVVSSVSGACGRRLCGGTFTGTLRLESFEGD
jgi:hypothetical protein